jgi:oxygen-dependent protoporphyrinogen oxidase
MARTIAIIGGGIAGLSASYYLKKSGVTHTVFEKSSQIGGVIRSQTIDGFTIENGPNTILLSDQRTLEMFNDLGLKIEEASPKSKNRYIVKNKECIPVPTSFYSFIKSPLFNISTKLKILTEAFRRNEPNGDEESVSQFIIRRFNKQILDYAINPFIAGTYAGDPDSLSIEHSFPLLYKTEKKYGSIIGGFINRRRHIEPDKIKRKTVSFMGGISELTKKMSQFSEDSISYQSQIYDITKTGDGYTLRFMRNGNDESFFCNDIISTIPTHALKNITINGDIYPDFEELEKINYPPVVSLSLGFKSEHISHSLEGFGALVPKCEKMNILGVLFSSSLFKNRSPKGYSLLTVFMGGSRQPKLTKLSNTERVDLAIADLKILLGVSAKPSFIQQTLWEKSIPQYHVGYGHYRSIINMVEAKLPNFYFAGNYLNGISIQDTIISSMNLINKRIG